VGLGGGRGDLAEDTFEVGVALAGPAGAVGGPGLEGAGTQPGQDTRCPAVGNTLMSSPISARIICAALVPMPGISSSRSIAASAVSPDRFRRQSISGMTVYEERCRSGCGAPEVYPGI
jgi:hypothetical protein